MSRANPNVLVVSNNKADVSELITNLIPVLGGNYSFNYCSSLSGVFCLFRESVDKPNVVILVLIDDQKSQVKCLDISSLKKVIGHVPVISLLETKDHEMDRWGVDHGVLNFLTSRPFSKDSDNLGAAIKMALLLDKISCVGRRRSQAKLRRIGNKCAKMARISEKEAAQNTLEEQRRVNADDLYEKDEIIFWLSGGYSVNKPLKKLEEDNTAVRGQLPEKTT